MFRAPELKAKQYVKENVDLWALGMILYYMAVGYLP
jgi:serine/threonine protein kinase